MGNAARLCLKRCFNLVVANSPTYLGIFRVFFKLLSIRIEERAYTHEAAVIAASSCVLLATPSLLCALL